MHSFYYVSSKFHFTSGIFSFLYILASSSTCFQLIFSLSSPSRTLVVQMFLCLMLSQGSIQPFFLLCLLLLICLGECCHSVLQIAYAHSLSPSVLYISPSVLFVRITSFFRFDWLSKKSFLVHCLNTAMYLFFSPVQFAFLLLWL